MPKFNVHLMSPIFTWPGVEAKDKNEATDKVFATQRNFIDPDFLSDCQLVAEEVEEERRNENRHLTPIQPMF